MKHLIIVGAGGMGRSMYLHAQNCIGYGTIFDVKGFLEIDKTCLIILKGILLLSVMKIPIIFAKTMSLSVLWRCKS